MTANQKNKAINAYEPHLVLREFSVPAGREWVPELGGWALIQVDAGAGYWLHGQVRTELAAGSLLLVSGDGAGRVLASQLDALTLQAFNLIPERLTGLMTLGEQNLFGKAKARMQPAFLHFPAQNPLAAKMSALRSDSRTGGLMRKLQMTQIMIEAFGGDFEKNGAGLETSDARERLRIFLQELPPNALLEISFDQLAQMNNCTPRHLSRIFYDVVGMSFRDKRAEIRLARARELLATSQTKVVEVALESGYKSVSLFNLMFTRRFGVSPGRWRQKNQTLGKTDYASRVRPAKLWPNHRSRQPMR
jgi:AraC-like DNA-binding protein